MANLNKHEVTPVFVGLPARLTDQAGKRLMALCKESKDPYQESVFESILDTDAIIKRHFATALTGRLGKNNIHRTKHANSHLGWSILPQADMAVRHHIRSRPPLELSDPQLWCCEHLPMPYLLVLDYIKTEGDIGSVTPRLATELYQQLLEKGITFGIHKSQLIAQHALFWPYLLVAMSKFSRELQQWEKQPQEQLNELFEAYWGICKLLQIEHFHSIDPDHLACITNLTQARCLDFIQRYKANLGYSSELFRIQDFGKDSSYQNYFNRIEKGTRDKLVPAQGIGMAQAAFLDELNTSLDNFFNHFGLLADFNALTSFQDDRLYQLFEPDPFRLMILPMLPPDEDENLNEMELDDLKFTKLMNLVMIDHILLESGKILPANPTLIAGFTERLKTSLLQELSKYRDHENAPGSVTDLIDAAAAAFQSSRTLGVCNLRFYHQLMRLCHLHDSKLGRMPEDWEQIDRDIRRQLLLVNQQVANLFMADDENVPAADSVFPTIEQPLKDVSALFSKLENTQATEQLTEIYERARQSLSAQDWPQVSDASLHLCKQWRIHLNEQKAICSDKDNTLSAIRDEITALIKKIETGPLIEPVATVEPAHVAVEAHPSELALLALQSELAASQARNNELNALLSEQREENSKLRRHHKQAQSKLDSVTQLRPATFAPQWQDVDTLATRLVATLPKQDMQSVMTLAEHYTQGRIRFTENAMDSAQAYRRQEYSAIDLMSALIKLADFYYPAFIEFGDNQAKSVFGAAYSPTESESTLTSARLRSLREFDINGETKMVTKHLSINNYLRLYFTIEGDTVVIPYLGKHLDVMSTN